MVNLEAYRDILSTIPKSVALVAVSKTKPVEDILFLYQHNQKVFGENKVQELCAKYEQLPKDIEWHLIGHLQTNKVKYIASFVSLIHAVDSLKLLKEINKEAHKNNRIISCLLQIHIAQEETKFGFSYNEVEELLASSEISELQHIKITGLMGMATLTSNKQIIMSEFNELAKFYDRLKLQLTLPNCNFSTLSMGMSNDYKIAIDCGSNMIRIGSTIFGSR